MAIGQATEEKPGMSFGWPRPFKPRPKSPLQMFRELKAWIENYMPHSKPPWNCMSDYEYSLLNFCQGYQEMMQWTRNCCEFRNSTSYNAMYGLLTLRRNSWIRAGRNRDQLLPPRPDALPGEDTSDTPEPVNPFTTES